MINTFFGFDYIFDIQTYQSFFLATILGLIFRQVLSTVMGQEWVRSYSQLVIFAILPVTGFMITNIISNNIALSLGMVGALSIVRFRTPVKNPFELVSYFILITLGIVLNVNQNVAVNFILFSILIFTLIEVFLQFSKRYFNLNSEKFESNKFYLSIETSEELEKFNLNEFMHFSSSNNIYIYRFSSNDMDQLLEIKNEFDINKIKSTSIDASG
tara:strand:- start:542 stop:1183 length:642 start_codon:yes stop_codon:yes gene_type:complete